MASVNPYLNYNGNCEEAFRFYQSVFGGEFSNIQRFKDIPSESPLTDQEGEKIMHIALPVGKNSILMASDVPQYLPQSSMGTNFSISIDTESEEEARKIFERLTSGGQITMPMEKTFWGAFFGMLVDKFGIQWMVGYTYK